MQDTLSCTNESIIHSNLLCYYCLVGVPLIDGGTVRLPALIGLSRALDLILTGRAVTAEEGLSIGKRRRGREQIYFILLIGLVNRVVPVGQGLEEALKLANQIAAFPQPCLRHDRQSAINSSHDQSRDLRHEYETAQDLIKEAIRGAQSFSQGLGRSGKIIEINDQVSKN